MDACSLGLLCASGANGNEITHDIRSWRFNADDAPTIEDFRRPEDRPGWRVHEWK
jgi:hypothetical protein